LKRTGDWIRYILHRNCLLKHINEVKLEGGLEVTEKQERRRKQLLDDLKETRDSVNRKRKHKIDLYQKVVFEEAMDLS
jgi:hypothetical protein